MRRLAAAIALTATLAACSADPPAPIPESAPAAPATATPPPPSPTARTLQASDLKLTVRETRKQCFGSAGCNVEWEIDVGLDGTLDDGVSYDVTYAVRGLVDEQVGTLTIHDHNVVTQRPGFGEKAKSKTKLTAVVTHLQRTTLP